jgi:hypothetical protein
VIAKNFLEKETILKIQADFLSREPVQFYVFDDFIDPNFFALVENEMKSNSIHIIDTRKEWYISNKTIYFSWENFNKLYNYFQTPQFISFLSLFYKTKIRKHHPLSIATLDDMMKELQYQWWGIAQIYTEGDHMSWHTDICKDMVRDQMVRDDDFTARHNLTFDSYEEVGAFIYYVHNSDVSWQESYGWVLEIGKFQDTKIIPYEKVLPKRNRLVLIKSSSISYHRVTPVAWNHFRITFQDLLQKA